MKNAMKSVLLGALLMGGVLLSDGIMAQAPPPPPPPPGDHGSGTNKGPLGAPIDGGLAVFIAFAAGYAGREWMKRKKE